MVRGNFKWWFGLPVIMFLFAGMPYWIWNVISDSSLVGTWWRISIIPQGVFDTYIYLQWLGASIAGDAGANQSFWLVYVLRALYKIMPVETTLPELWVTSRWIAVTCSVWIGGWALARWSGLPRAHARVLSLILWVGTLLTLSMRPGIFASYWPFAILALYAMHRAIEYLDDQKWKRAFGWTLCAVFFSSVYPWIFVFVALWAGVGWGSWITLRFRKLFVFLLSVIIVSIVAMAPFIAAIAGRGEVIATLEKLDRVGIVFARLPFFSNTVLVMCGWIGIIGSILVLNRRSSESLVQRISILFSAWVSLLFAWFHTPFTGLFTHNDHFVSIVLLMSGLSVAAIWTSCKDRTMLLNRRLFIGVLIFAGLFFFRILLKASGGEWLKLDSYVIHLANWWLLAVAGSLVCWRDWFDRQSQRPWLTWSLVFSPLLFVSVLSFVFVIVRGAPQMGTMTNRELVIAWIKANIPPGTTMCAESDVAAFYAAHTGIPVLPSEGPISYPYSKEKILHQLTTIVGSLDVAATPRTYAIIRFYSSYFSDRTCSQYGLQIKLLRWVQVPEKWIERLSGCYRETYASNLHRIEQAAAEHRLDQLAFTEICPFVIIEKDRRNVWQLPSTYRAVDVGDGTAIWTPTQTPSAVN